MDVADKDTIKISETDLMYMRRCLQLARNGSGSTSPNPMVGAVIVCDGRIIGEGYHIRAGQPHAEVNAVASVAEADRPLLGSSTIYVSLEPCSHYGKTPPCCDLIISLGIPRVVVAATDVNSRVNGEGISRMRQAGIEVVVGVLADEAVALNSHFFTLHGKGRPYVMLKWAETADGYIDSLRDGGAPLSISDSVSQVAVHKLRSEFDAIIVGTRTARLDNPSLTTRLWGGCSPLRLVIDRCGILSASLRLFDGESPTVVYTETTVEGKFGDGVQQKVLDFSCDIVPQILGHLASIGVNSLLVEGGARLHSAFLSSGLWDAIRVERNPHLQAGGGVAAAIIPAGTEHATWRCSGNEITLYMNCGA